MKALSRHKEVKEVEKTKTVTEPETGWNDYLEAIQYTTQVFASMDRNVGVDFVLARLTNEQKDFMVEHVKHAIALRKQVPDPEVAERIFNTIITEAVVIAILHRNVDDNRLLEIIGGVYDKAKEMPEMEETTALKEMGHKAKGINPFGKKGRSGVSGE